jgi:hypothetical protein
MIAGGMNFSSFAVIRVDTSSHESHDFSTGRALHHRKAFPFRKNDKSMDIKKRHECNFFLDINFAQNYTFV